jgi:Leucine-rich repeat (LRR) protein
LKIHEDLKDRDYLIASKNSIPKLEDNSILNIPNLLRIDLRDNKIIEISSGAFNGLPKLMCIYLDNNFIEELRVGTFDPLAKLKVLGLQNNKIKILTEGIFDKNPNLGFSHFDQNEIFAIGPNVLKPGKEWHLKGNKCVDETFLENSTNLLTKLKTCLENYQLYQERCITFDTFLHTEKSNGIGLDSHIKQESSTEKICDCAETTTKIESTKPMENSNLISLSIALAGLIIISLLLNGNTTTTETIIVDTPVSIEPTSHYCPMNAEAIGARNLKPEFKNDQDDDEIHVYDELNDTKN